MGSRMVDVPGGALYVEDEGSGQPVVLLHAGIVDLRAWDPLVPLLVDRGLRAIRYDARGYGRTTTEDVPFSNRADVVAVLDAARVDRACLVGNSRGGQIALDTAAEHPERIAAVVMVGANVGGYEPEPTPEEAAIFEEMDRIEGALAETGDVEGAADLMVRVWVDGLRQPPGRAPAAIRDAVRAMAAESADPNRVHGKPIPLDPPTGARLASLTMPILALAGEFDVSDIWATAQHLERACPNARAVRVSGVAHMIAMERPELVARHIADLLEPLGPFG